MSTPTVSAAPQRSKSDLRRHALRLRATLPGDRGPMLAAHLCAWLGPVAERVIAGYYPIGSEIDVLPALRQLAALGAVIALPVVAAPGQPLIFRAWNLTDPLQPGPHGTRQPEGSAIQPDCLLVPLLAFDARGYRLGYGAGYYDRTLAAHPNWPAIGCAHCAQRVPDLPTTEHDRRLTAVATERGVVDHFEICGGL